jgi:dynactin complex subunit
MEPLYIVPETRYGSTTYNPKTYTYEIQDKVLVNEERRVGELCFVGTLRGKEGKWYGIRLNKPLGDNDGTYKGEFYFKCAMEHGIFVQKKDLLPFKYSLLIEKRAKPKAATRDDHLSSKPELQRRKNRK